MTTVLSAYSELPIPTLLDLNPDPDLCSKIGSKSRSRSLSQGWDLNPDPIFSDPNPDPTIQNFYVIKSSQFYSGL